MSSESRLCGSGIAAAASFITGLTGTTMFLLTYKIIINRPLLHRLKFKAPRGAGTTGGIIMLMDRCRLELTGNYSTVLVRESTSRSLSPLVLLLTEICRIYFTVCIVGVSSVYLITTSKTSE